MTDVYVYGLLATPAAERACAADPSGRLTAVPGGAVAAVCEPASAETIATAAEDDTRLAALARRHDAVVHLLAGFGPTLPVRMGTVCVAARLGEALTTTEAELLAQLAHLRGCSEWRLRVRSAAPGRETAPSARSALSGTEYLLRQQARRAAVAEQPAFADLDAVVAEFSVGSGPVTEAGDLRSRSYLIEDARTDALFERVGPLLEQASARGEETSLSGPLPAYSFADVRLGGAQ
jgi:hypothetical protein